MKKLHLLIVALSCFVGINSAEAQRGTGCTPDLTCTGSFGAVCPTTMPTATAGTFYSEVVTFYFPDTASFTVVGQTLDGEVDSVLVEISNLPTGLTFACGTNSCWFPVDALNRHGCAVIYGTPCEVADTFEFDIEFTFAGTVILPFVGPVSGIAPAALPFPATLPLVGTLPTLEITSVTNTQFLCPTGNGSTIDLEASAGFDDYNWSTGDTDSIISVTSSGWYNLSATHNTGCVIQDSIELYNLNIVATNDTTICANTFFVLNASGGDVFNWSPSANLSSNFDNDPLILRGLTANQTFTVVASNGFCSDTTTVDINIDNSCGLGICAACTLDTVGCGGNIPTVCQQLPVAIAGEDYEESFSFFFPGVFDLKAIIPQAIKDQIQGSGVFDTADLPAFPVNEFYIELADLPQGFTWESDQNGNGNFYYPNKHTSAQYGCVSLCGRSCDVAGEYLDFMVFAEAPQTIIDLINTGAPLLQLVGIDLPFTVQGNYLGIPVPITSLTFEYETPLVVTPSGSTNLLLGDTLTLEANGGFTDYLWSTGATTASIDVTDAGTYTVSATDANGCVQEFETVVTIYSGVAEMNAFAESLAIYPNPNKGNFNVTFDLAQNQNVTIEVINLQGKVISSQTLAANAGANNLPVNMQAAAGVYFVKIQTIDGAISRRIAVQ